MPTVTTSERQASKMDASRTNTLRAYRVSCTGEKRLVTRRPAQNAKVRSDWNGLVVFIMSVLTLGIYFVYVVGRIAKDLNRICEGDGMHTLGSFVFLLALYPTCGLYAVAWLFCLGERMHKNAPRYGIQLRIRGWELALWFVIAVGLPILLVVLFSHFDYIASISADCALVFGEAFFRIFLGSYDALAEAYNRSLIK